MSFLIMSHHLSREEVAVLIAAVRDPFVAAGFDVATLGQMLSVDVEVLAERVGCDVARTLRAEVESAVSTLVESNLRLARKLANSHANRIRLSPAFDHDDLFAEAACSLRKVALAFDVRKGYAFSTLATMAINRDLVRTSCAVAGTVSLPEGRVAELAEKTRELRDAQTDGTVSGSPSVSEIVAVLDISRSDALLLLVDPRQGISLQQPRRRGHTASTFEDLVSEHDDAHVVEQVRILMMVLQPYERTLLALTYGLRTETTPGIPLDDELISTVLTQSTGTDWDTKRVCKARRQALATLKETVLVA